MESDAHLLLLEQIAASLHQLVRLTRILSYPTIKQLLETALDTDSKRMVYDLTDGKNGVKAIQEATSVNVRYVSEWWQEWEKLGIVEQCPDSPKGRRHKLLDLDAFGIIRTSDSPGAEGETK